MKITRQATDATVLAELGRQGAEPSPDDITLLNRIASAAARPGQRYRCAACGFEAQQHFWQCPGCQGWDSYPPRRLEDA